MNFIKGSLFHRSTEPEEVEIIEESGGGVLAVWGSPGCGKTVTAVKIAKHLASQKKNVALLLCDMTAPMLPCICPASELEGDKSLGSIFAAQRISVNLIKHNLTTHKKLSYLTILGLRKGRERVYLRGLHQAAGRGTHPRTAGDRPLCGHRLLQLHRQRHPLRRGAHGGRQRPPAGQLRSEVHRVPVQPAPAPSGNCTGMRTSSIKLRPISSLCRLPTVSVKCWAALLSSCRTLRNWRSSIWRGRS